MKTKIFGLALSAMIFALSYSASAQQPKKVSRIGYLSGIEQAGELPRSEGIRVALRELGYIEGQNIAIEYRYTEGKQDRYPELAAELVRLKVDIIAVAGATRLILAAKNATTTIPIVMFGFFGNDPTWTGFLKAPSLPIFPWSSRRSLSL